MEDIGYSMPDPSSSIRRRSLSIALIAMAILIQFTLITAEIESVIFDSDISLDRILSTYEGAINNRNFGEIVTMLNDINGDMIDDFVIFSYNNETCIVYLVYGNSTRIENQRHSTDIRNYIIDDHEKFFYCSPTNIGDINGDGLGDILMDSKNSTDNSGKGYFIFGQKEIFDGSSVLSNIANLTTWNLQYRHSFGGNGDINGDGINDLLISEYEDSEHGSNSGKTYIIFSKYDHYDGILGKNDTLTNYYGENENDRSGYSLDASGDVNGDGYDDILISAFTNSESYSRAGKTYLIFGEKTFNEKNSNLSDRKSVV